MQNGGKRDSQMGGQKHTVPSAHQGELLVAGGRGPVWSGDPSVPSPNLAAGSAGTRLADRKTIQDLLLDEGRMAVRLSAGVESADALQVLLIKQFKQNSLETRTRYAQSVLKWFFGDEFNGLARRVWMAYQDDAILTDVLRYFYLSQEPVMGRCISEALLPLEIGITVPPSYFDRFLQEHFGEMPPDKTRDRLKMNLKKLGFLERAKGRPDRLVAVTPQKTSLVILLHYLFAANAIKTVELRGVFANPFWKYLGYKSEDSVRAVLREADHAGFFGKYVVADQLEQITTCFTFHELLQRRTRL
jgi:hypothetical protein